MSINWISREEEAKLPKFESHDEARAYFKVKYGNRFQMVDTNCENGVKVYYYKLIVNEDAYFNTISSGNFEIAANDFEGISSSQSIEIWDDGRVHIVH